MFAAGSTGFNSLQSESSIESAVNFFPLVRRLEKAVFWLHSYSQLCRQYDAEGSVAFIVNCRVGNACYLYFKVVCSLRIGRNLVRIRSSIWSAFNYSERPLRMYHFNLHIIPYFPFTRPSDSLCCAVSIALSTVRFNDS